MSCMGWLLSFLNASSGYKQFSMYMYMYCKMISN